MNLARIAAASLIHAAATSDSISRKSGKAGGNRSEMRLALGRFHQSQRIHELNVEDGETEFLPAEVFLNKNVIRFRSVFNDRLFCLLNSVLQIVGNIVTGQYRVRLREI